MADSSQKIRVRFAPSPTGFQHIGGLRTALYNYLFAKKHEGRFILRIEDTDQKRFVEGAIENTINFLNDFGILYDEGPVLEKDKIEHRGEYGPYIQSERLSIYQQYATELLHSQKAYRCFCSPERLEKLRTEQQKEGLPTKYPKHCLSLTAEEVAEYEKQGSPFVVRLNVQADEGRIEFSDLVRGPISMRAADLDDQVLLKSDGFPTGVFSIVVDDALMKISHVIRGEEWLPTTPKQILIYQALGWERPEFAHLPNILGSDGKKKLSKRDGDVSVDSFIGRGYLRETLINFVALLGWNPGQGSTQEIFSLDELVQAFDLSQVHKAGAVFDLRKLDWMNGEYLKKLSLDELYEKIKDLGVLEKPMIAEAPADMQSETYLKKVLAIERERMNRLTDFGENDTYFFREELEYAPDLLNWKNNSREYTVEELKRAKKLLAESAEQVFDDKDVLAAMLLEAAGDKRGDFLWPLRVALTGTERSPSPGEVAWVLGRDRTLERVTRAIENLH